MTSILNHGQQTANLSEEQIDTALKKMVGDGFFSADHQAGTVLAFNKEENEWMVVRFRVNAVNVVLESVPMMTFPGESL